MAIVKGPGGRFYEIPQDILEEHALSEQQEKKLRSRAVKISLDDMEDQDVEGYGTFLYDYEGFGYICGFPHNISES
jgi:hypothetical protein